MSNTYNNLWKVFDLPIVHTFICNTTQDMVIFYISIYSSEICCDRKLSETEIIKSEVKVSNNG